MYRSHGALRGHLCDSTAFLFCYFMHLFVVLINSLIIDYLFNVVLIVPIDLLQQNRAQINCESATQKLIGLFLVRSVHSATHGNGIPRNAGEFCV